MPSLTKNIFYRTLEKLLASTGTDRIASWENILITAHPSVLPYPPSSDQINGERGKNRKKIC